MNAKQKLARVVTFVAENDIDLQHGCLLLGGSPALSRLQRFRRRLAKAEKLTSAHRCDLCWLHGLFRLEHVHEFENDEADYFASVAIDDPIVSVVCTLTEALDALLTELNQRVSGASNAVSAAA